MRPLPGSTAGHRSGDAESAAVRPQSVPVHAGSAYFITDEATLDAMDEPLAAPTRSQDGWKQSTTDHDKTRTASEAASSSQQYGGGSTCQQELSSSEASWVEAGAESSAAIQVPGSVEPGSLPVTPALSTTPGPCSTFSSASSRRNSLLSSEYPESHVVPESAYQELSGTTETNGSAPQLIMPTLAIPSRRPFTEVGQALGRLKVLIAGTSGIGKTSLIKAVVQSCEHIVHVDPISSGPRSLVTRGQSKGEAAAQRTDHITEIYASTKPYPTWWSELDQPGTTSRRKVVEGMVLDRNLCFVDTPGFRSNSAALVVDSVVDYVEGHLRKNLGSCLSEPELLNTLGGGGGSLVDVVFYILPRTGIQSEDIEYLRRLEPLTNIVPLLAQADSLSPPQLAEAKVHISDQLTSAGIRPFRFTSASDRELAAPVVYGVSSAPVADFETMDASLLMDSCYVQPLVPTDLPLLLEQVFCHDGSSWLRHSAAKKYLRWKQKFSGGPDRDAQLVRWQQGLGAHWAYSGTTGACALVRVGDHTNHDDYLGQIRLVNWAADLQRSLANERARNECLAREEQIVWLTDRRSGTLVSTNQRQGHEFCETARHRQPSKVSMRRMSRHQDPLGLLQFVAELKRKGWVALEVLGSLGLLSGLALWVSRHGWHLLRV